MSLSASLDLPAHKSLKPMEPSAGVDHWTAASLLGHFTLYSFTLYSFTLYNFFLNACPSVLR